uniref:Uncharacterized protein LOC111132760 n=1 Tax=Crassostrea virginica TaxID=6565 RepID=A0A8B8E822_CRAVI|nr:uncharacterized protein LOC111132760 [Crassostrea virginica]
MAWANNTANKMPTLANEWLLSGIPHIVTPLKEASSREVLREPCAALPYKSLQFRTFRLLHRLTMDPQRSGQDVVRCTLCEDAVAPMFCKELEEFILPKYQESAAIIKTQKVDQLKNSQKLTLDLKKQGEALHKEIDAIIQSTQTEIDVMDSKEKAALHEQEDEIKHTITEIKQVIQDLNILLDTFNVSFVSKYQSRIEEFRKLPPNLKIFLPHFNAHKINREQLLKQFGSLTALSIETEEQGYTMPSPGAEFSPPARPMLDVPRLVTDIPTT